MHAYWHGGWWFWSFWWLIFPIMGFVFGGFGMWMNYRAQRDRMELMKTYVAQGKDPDEIAKLLSQVGGPGLDPAPGPGAWGGDPWGGGPGYGRWGHGRWGYGRWGYGPVRDWRRFITFACLALGFFLASQYADFPGTEQAFTLVAIIMGVLAVGSFAVAILSTLMSRNMNGNDVRKNGG